MSFSMIGALAGAVAAALALVFFASPRSWQQRLGHIGTIIGLATVPPMIGGVVDSELQRQADIISEQRATLREERAREEMRRGFQNIQEEMTGSVRQILTAFHDLPPGPRRARAIQSALQNYDRATSRLGRNSRTNVASLLPLAVENQTTAATVPPAGREARPAQQNERRETEPDGSVAAATVPVVTSATSAPPPVVITPVFIPPPVIPVMIPPTVVMAPH